MPRVAYETVNPDDFLVTPMGRLWTPERNKVAWEEAFARLTRILSLPQTDTLAGRAHDVYVVCGLQGAGKSTWIRSNGERLGPCVFFDAALPRAVHRRPIVTIAHAAGARVHAVWIDVPLEVALERNALRRDDERVPEEAIRSVAGQFEAPDVAEGFVDVILVRDGCVDLKE